MTLSSLFACMQTRKTSGPGKPPPPGAMAAALLLLLLLLFGPSTSADDTPMTDATALLFLKNYFTNTAALSSWYVPSDGAANPCDPKSPWAGLICMKGILTGLHLASMGLGGTINIDALTHFKSLRSVNFAHNSLTGPIPALSRLDALKAIYLQNNHFSGDIPDDFFTNMDHLKKLWLSGNSFTGSIPSSLSKATALMELYLDNNGFSGTIPDLPLATLSSLNVSHNSLEGVLPASLSAKFNSSSFDGNPGLCGAPLRPCSVPSEAVPLPAVPTSGGSGKIAGICVVLILAGCMLVVGAEAIRRRREGDFETLGVESCKVEDGVMFIDNNLPGSGSKGGASTHRLSHRRSSTKSGSVAGARREQLVVVNDTKGPIGLPDLMKAAAEVIGTGGMGSAYKAVMSNGEAVVVKRMREMNKVGKEVFDVEMRRLGRLQHPNVLPPLAYHYRKDEKLLVLEFVSKGSLLYILHGDRGADNAALDWTTRLKIIRGITSGMAYLHSELNSLDLPHGNLKSSNVILSPTYDPLLVDYGFISLVNPSQASLAMFAYKSPESLQQRHVSPKSDVYCLGIIILEVLTGKFPSQYLNNTKGGTDVVQWVTSAVAEDREAELLDPVIILSAKSSVPEMERLLRIGAAFVVADPEQRPDMKDAAARVEEVATAVAAKPTLKEGNTELATSTQWRTKSIGERSAARRGDDAFAFAIS